MSGICRGCRYLGTDAVKNRQINTGITIKPVTSEYSEKEQIHKKWFCSFFNGTAEYMPHKSIFGDSENINKTDIRESQKSSLPAGSALRHFPCPACRE